MGASSSIFDQNMLFKDIQKEYEKHSSLKQQHSDFEAEDDDVSENHDSNPDGNNSAKLFNDIKDLYTKWQLYMKFKEDVIVSELTSLESSLRKAFQSGLTPLIVDTSPDDKICTFFSYQPDAIILEAKSLIFSKKEPLEKTLDNCRKVLVNAMKHGKLLIIRLGTSAPDFRHKLNDNFLSTIHPLKTIQPTMSKSHKHKINVDKNSSDKLYDEVDEVLLESYFPTEVFIQGGALLHENSWIERLFREDDMKPHKNFAICREEFRVCVTTQLPLDQLEECLFLNGEGNLPDKSLFKVIEILPEIDEIEDNPAPEAISEEKNSNRDEQEYKL